MSNPLVEADQQQRNEKLLELLRKWLTSNKLLAYERQQLIAETQQAVDNGGY